MKEDSQALLIGRPDFRMGKYKRLSERHGIAQRGQSVIVSAGAGIPMHYFLYLSCHRSGDKGKRHGGAAESERSGGVFVTR